jgi:hypothetical protein
VFLVQPSFQQHACHAQTADTAVWAADSAFSFATFSEN